MKLLVIVPSRLDRDATGRTFLAGAIDSVASQRPADPFVDVEASIGIDASASPPSDLVLPAWASVRASSQRSQAAALNAAATTFAHDFLAILEDDDRWLPDHLRTSLAALLEHHLDFVSTTQLQVDERGDAISIFDFPTPSGWVMRREVWETVGGFDESFRFHLDNDWLGRLALSGFRRGHLVEATAPVETRWLAVRPWLQHVLTNGGPQSRLLRHGNHAPLVTRLVHAGSGMTAVHSDGSAHATSRDEYLRLAKRYGRIPW